MKMEPIIDVSGLPDVEFVDGIRINDIDKKLLHGKKKTPQSAWSLLLLLDFPIHFDLGTGEPRTLPGRPGSDALYYLLYPFWIMSRINFLDFCFLINFSAFIASVRELKGIVVFKTQGIPLLVQMLFFPESLWNSELLT